MGYVYQSGVGNLGNRKSIPRERARQAAIFLSDKTGYDITVDWILDGGPDLPRLKSKEPPPCPPGSVDARVQALPEALREYVMQALALAERVKPLIPEQFVRPPDGDSYRAFHKYLTDLADTLPGR